VVSDAIGNITSYAGWTYNWQAGRQLVSQTNAGGMVEYKYNADGLRVQKKKGNIVTDYVLSGKNIVHMTITNGPTMHFYYDAQDRPAQVVYNGVTYRYVHNLQGDIIAIVDANGNTVVQYTYGAWGEKKSVTGVMATTLGKYNLFRYRGYVYDEETWMYYLRSRYYYPELQRFIGADILLNKISEVRSQSTYAYCLNNSVNRVDSSGRESIPFKGLEYPSHLNEFFEGDVVFGSTNPLPYFGEPFSYTYGYNPSGELYERWYGPDRLPEMDIHHSDHGHPKYHTNPHKHIWQRDLNGKWSPGKPTNLNDDDKKRSQKGKRNVDKADNSMKVVLTAGLGYILFKLLVATLSAPVTGGTSFFVLITP
jgi:RHS repeat-associated protein